MMMSCDRVGSKAYCHKPVSITQELSDFRAVPEQVATRAGVRRCRVREEPADAVTLVR